MALVQIQGKTGKILDISSSGGFLMEVTGILDKEPVTGSKTISTVPISLCAGAQKLTGRKQMIVYNNSPTAVYWGGVNVDVLTSMVLESGDSVTFTFAVPDIDIYFVASDDSEVRVVEI